MTHSIISNLEKQTLFEYATNHELQEIHNSYNHPLHPRIVAWIRSETTNGWIPLVKEYEKDLSFPMHTVLKAAYCQGKLTIDELATAYIFLAPASFKHHYTILPMDDPKFHGKLDRWNDRSLIPKNLQYFIVIQTADLTKKVQQVVNSLFQEFHPFLRDANDVAGGIALERVAVRGEPSHVITAALGSAALIKNDALVRGHPPVFVRGLSQRPQMYAHTEKGVSDFGLLDPAEAKQMLVHGGIAESIYPYAHDGYHAATRVSCGIFERPDVQAMGKRIEYLLQKMPLYSKPEVVLRHYAIPILDEDPTDDDIARFVLEEISGQILDGEAFGLKDGTCHEIFNRCLNKKLAYIVPIDCKRIVPLLNTYLHELNIELYQDEKYSAITVFVKSKL